MNEILASRAMSGFPVSIGTGLALESILDPTIALYDESRVVPERIDKSKYDLILINLSTILRNIISSIKSEQVNTIKIKDYTDVLIEELNFLNDTFVLEDIEPVFYINDYAGIKGRFSEDKLRTPNTNKQIEVSTIQDRCLFSIKKEEGVRVFHDKLSLDNSLKALIFTHIPWDLTSYKNFITLDLLESHTGVLKTKKDWNSKYYKLPNKDMSILPFSELLLPTFGDHVMFKPDPLTKRVELYNLLELKKVNPLTSDNTLKLLLP